MNIDEERDASVEALGNKVEGFDTSTKFVLERLTSNLVETRVSDASQSLDSYELKPDKLVRRFDLLEHDVQLLYNK